MTPIKKDGIEVFGVKENTDSSAHPTNLESAIVRLRPRIPFDVPPPKRSMYHTDTVVQKPM
jgi:hypothetical protein